MSKFERHTACRISKCAEGVRKGLVYFDRLLFDLADLVRDRPGPGKFS